MTDGRWLFECPDCKAQQPEAGSCGRCPGVVQPVRWDAGDCYICGEHVLPSDGWHREDYDGVSRHWCPNHQPVWSREAVERLVVVARNYVEADARLQRRIDTRDIREALTALEADV